MHYIDTTSDLDHVTAQLKKNSFIALDTEFIAEKTYFPQLCLIQIASDDDVFIIDTLAKNINLTSFICVLLDANIKKIFHSAHHDIEVFYKLFGIMPVNVADTQILAMACGYPEHIAYDKLVKIMLNTDLDKTERMSKWDKRPLSNKQLAYAEADVKYLQKIYKIIHTQLLEKGRQDWCDEETNKLLDINNYKHSEQNVIKRLKFTKLPLLSRYILLQLAIWREKKAIAIDKPLKSILREDMMLEISRFMPQKLEQLNSLRIYGNQIYRKSYVDEIVATVQNAKQYYKNNRTNVKELFKNDTFYTRNKKIQSEKNRNDGLDLALLLLRIISREEGIAPQLIASNGEIENFLNYEDCNFRFYEGWRRKILYEKLLLFRDGKIYFFYRAGKLYYACAE